MRFSASGRGHEPAWKAGLGPGTKPTPRSPRIPRAVPQKFTLPVDNGRRRAVVEAILSDMTAEQAPARGPGDGSRIAGYREIQAHWGLESIAAVRIKAKQAGWPIARRDDPREPTRYVIPLTEWNRAERSPAQAEPGEAARFKAMDARLSTLSATLQTMGEQLQCERNRAEASEAQAAQLRSELVVALAQLAQLSAELNRYRTEQEVIERMGFLGRLAWTVRDRAPQRPAAAELSMPS